MYGDAAHTCVYCAGKQAGSAPAKASTATGTAGVVAAPSGPPLVRQVRMLFQRSWRQVCRRCCWWLSCWLRVDAHRCYTACRHARHISMFNIEFHGQMALVLSRGIHAGEPRSGNPQVARCNECSERRCLRMHMVAPTPPTDICQFSYWPSSGMFLKSRF